ncbi:Reverse transcriptase, RNA-dependent DNA polymerase [Lasallia pustulata]|uniref:Reverse transcriptase, RNA-dependent DNA polymerase n=1 Tax=Lasallia pustulata TaxID=136370 RepID=A0A1W5D9I2_9LECA|nr:Reverse transcriptase, RNA-dependent DNA polymerase [Lasallia pustulata]
MPKEPDGYTEMLRHPHAEGFKQAMAVEITALKSKGIWREVSHNHAVAAGKIPIPTRWVYKNKYDEQRFFVKYKARLCACGDLQKTLQHTFAATLAARIFRALMAIVAAFDLETRQFDASPALWYRHLSATLINLGLETVPGVQCLHTNQYMLVFFFVDDIAVIYDRKFTHQVNEFEKKLCRTYEMRSLGQIEWFLGIHITRERYSRHLWLCQESYIDKVTTRFTITSISNTPNGISNTPNGISNTPNSISNTPNNTSNTLKRRVETPLPVEDFSKSTAQASAQDIYLYQQKIGSLNFAAVITRPDIAHATSTLSSFLKNPSPRHMELADRVLIYLAHTKEYAIEINPNSNTRKVFNASSDASYGNDPDSRRSTQGFFEAIGFKPGHQTTIECDNQQTIRILTSDDPRLTTKLQHIDIHHHWLRQEVQASKITIQWTPSAKTLADGFTKPLPIQNHRSFVELLGITNLATSRIKEVEKGGL